MRDFLANVQKHIDRHENEQKKLEIGKVLNSLQKPFADILQSVVVKQAQDVENLLKHLGWKKD